MKNTKFLLLACVCGFAMGGCRTPSTVKHTTGRAAEQQVAIETNNAVAAKPVNRSEAPYQEDLSLASKEDFLTLVKGGVPAELKNTIEIRDYKFEQTRIEELPEVRLEVFNLRDDRPVTFEIRTLFFRDNDTVFDATEWVTATAPPRGSYRYRAIAWSKYAKSEQVQIRLLQEGEAKKR